MRSQASLKIAHVDTGLGLRGGQRQMLMLIEGLRKRGHEQRIVCQEESELEQAARDLQFPVNILPALDPWHAFGAMLFRQQIKAWQPEIIHAHDGRGQSVAWIASAGLPVKRVASRRVIFMPADLWTYRLKYKRTCDAVIAVSKTICELSVQAGVPRENIYVIPDGIEVPPALPSAADRARLRHSWDVNDSHFLIGLLGTSTPEKGHDVAFEAVSMLKELLPTVKLVLAGNENETDQESTINGLNNNNCAVVRIPSLCNLDDFFPGLDLFVMPSRSEGLGSSALWAMAYGIPIVASRVGGLPEIVQENETGWLVPPDSPTALADAIVKASQSRETLLSLGRNGRQLAEGFSADIMLDRTEALYYLLKRTQ